MEVKDQDYCPMYEKLNERPITRHRFYKRLFFHFTLTLLLVTLSLAVGIVGLMYLEGMSFHKAFMHTAILLSGQGLVEKPVTEAGHWFMGVFGLYSGLIFLISLGVLMTPTIHRIVHKLHWEVESPEKDQE